jgi:Fic family protein
MLFDKQKPFNELPPLPPNKDVETKAILKKAIKANKALAELKSKVALLPNQHILLDTLTLIEAKDSSEIENIFTTHDKLFQASLLGEERADANTKEVSRYREALITGMTELARRPLSTNLFIKLVQIITLNDSGIRNTPGTKIATSHEEIIYTPPDGENLIRKKLANLEEFIHSEIDIDPLIKLGIMHYQFEAIHPFSDGNGRVGRIMNILFLIQEELLVVPILFLSRFFIENRNGYYLGLKNVTEKADWEGWILYILEAIETTSCQTITKIDEITDLMQEYIATIKAKCPKIYSKDLVEALFSKPYCRISSLNDIAKRQTASQYLRKIESLSLLESNKIGKDTVYVNKRLMDILRK